jgi:hypothetical protein
MVNLGILKITFNCFLTYMPVGVNYGELCGGSGCESCCAIISQLLWILLYYADPVDGNHHVNAVPVGVNHCELCWSSGCETLWVILSEWLWIILCYAERVDGNHGVICCASSCVSLCDTELGVWESWCAMMSRVCGNYGVLCWDEYVGIMVCFA